jgi:hypothetical protein
MESHDAVLLLHERPRQATNLHRFSFGVSATLEEQLGKTNIHLNNEEFQAVRLSSAVNPDLVASPSHIMSQYSATSGVYATDHVEINGLESQQLSPS